MAFGGTDLFAGVNVPCDPNNLSDLEKRHLPVITAPDAVARGECFDVEVEVGKMLTHPGERKHFIQFIQLCADDIFLARADLTAGRTHPKVRFSVTLYHPVKELLAYQHCNLHGVWVGRKALRVLE